MIMPPRPRFYALILAQFAAFLMIVFGMGPYWIGMGGAHVPSRVTLRVVAIGIVILGMFIFPLVRNTGSLITDGIGSGEYSPVEPVGDDTKKVRRLIWIYCYVDLGLLTYLVHTTGGITGSMFAGAYLLIPALALLLVLEPSDIGRTLLLISFSALGILGSFLMSHYDKVEYDAAAHKHAFDVALALVTVLGISIPLLQAVILKAQLKSATTAQTEIKPAARD